MNQLTLNQREQDTITSLRTDIDAAERQAIIGPFNEPCGVTPVSLLAYAKQCRQTITAIRTGAMRHGGGKPC